MATPEQRRDAWLALHRALKTTLEATREHARASLKLITTPSRQQGLTVVNPEDPAVADWEAAAWAADRLLRDLDGMRVPVLPKTPDPWQTTVEEQISDAERDAASIRQAVRLGLGDGSNDAVLDLPVTENTQAVDNPVEKRPVTHYEDPPPLQVISGQKWCGVFAPHQGGYWHDEPAGVYRHCAGM